MFDKKFLPLVLLFSGIINILLIKWSDKQYSKGSDEKQRQFQHPFIQTIVLFYGEFLCFILYKVIFSFLSRRRDGSEDTNIFTTGEREFSPTVFIFPTICDVVGTFLLLTGLYLSYPSSCQMLKGTSLIFVGLFSVSYFDQTLKGRHWLGILTLTLASILICTSDVNNIAAAGGVDSNGLLVGDLLIIIAQIFHALQMVYEEKYLKILNIPPLQVVGWEGIYGLAITSILLIPLNFLKIGIPFNNNPRGVIEDMIDAVFQIYNNPWLMVAHFLFMMFVILERFSTKYLLKDASTTGTVIVHCMGVVFVWLLSLGLGWEYFYYLNIIAFIVLFCGICIYKNVLFEQVYRLILVKMFRRPGDGIEEVINQPADAVI